MSVPIRTRVSGSDPVARTHRRHHLARAGFIVIGALALAVGSVWLLFISPLFAISDVRVEGGSMYVREDVTRLVTGVVGKKSLGVLRIAGNILLFDEASTASIVRSTFGNVRVARVTTEYPHAVRVTLEERAPIGTWCMKDVCQYFDEAGVRWGTAIPSRGPLLLLVQDERSDARWEQRLFAGMRAAVQGLPEIGLRPLTVQFTDTAPGDMHVRVSAGYDVIFDAQGDIADQLSTLGVLIADRAKTPGFMPQYIDIRTPGRAYYK